MCTGQESCVVTFCLHLQVDSGGLLARNLAAKSRWFLNIWFCEKILGLEFCEKILGLEFCEKILGLEFCEKILGLEFWVANGPGELGCVLGLEFWVANGPGELGCVPGLEGFSRITACLCKS